MQFSIVRRIIAGTQIEQLFARQSIDIWQKANLEQAFGQLKR